MEHSTPIVLSQRLQERFALAFKYKKVILFHAPCGYGKTAVAVHLLKTMDSVFVQGDAIEKLPQMDENQVLVIDNLQFMENASLQHELCHRIQAGGTQKIILLTRGEVPGYLMPFFLTGVMEVLEAEDLALDRKSIRALAALQGVSVSEGELEEIVTDTQGYPVLVSILLPLVKNCGSYRKEEFYEARKRLFAYLNEISLQQLPKHARKLLMNMAPFEKFDLELARMVTGDSRAGEIITALQQTSSVFTPGALEEFSIRPIYRTFFLWKVSVEMGQEEEKAIYMQAGLYYELKDNMKNALECYSKIHAHYKISELLQKNARLHVGLGHYLEMEKYYLSMPEDEIAKSPTLMAGMSMIYSLLMDYDKSDMWYEKLKEMAGSLKKTDEQYQEAQNRLMYLEIGLPQKGSEGLLELLEEAYQLSKAHKIMLPELSVTNALPSLINGGKDVCLWTKQDDLLYDSAKKTLEGVLGRDGVGITDLGMCESKFEKDQDYQPWLLNLAGQLTHIQREGTMDIEFAVVGLLARVQVMQGHPQLALETIQAFRSRIEELGENRFLPNLEALECRIHMRQGDRTEVNRWLTEDAPVNDQQMWVLHRYRYLTKAMALIANGDCSSALIILNRLLPYTRKCARTMDEIHVHLLSAICHHRMKNELWKKELALALDTTWEYQFVIPVTQYGRAILPLLTACKWNRDKAYLERLIVAARTQATFYPMFLQQESRLLEPLTASEKQVLQLLCKNMSNQDICDILGIKLATVKTHVSHILQKLCVKSRNKVKAAAEKNGLL